ncbi:MAG: hypothetical protein NUW13_06445, partial [candidate division KSB1 bacterium]|nr:hypothetical protein [candidate division KSB1 bacterium]
RIEQELYKTEPITCERELVDKTASYLLFSHLHRPHYGLPHEARPALTPAQLLHQPDHDTTGKVLPGYVKSLQLLERSTKARVQAR